MVFDQNLELIYAGAFGTLPSPATILPYQTEATLGVSTSDLAFQMLNQNWGTRFHTLDSTTLVADLYQGVLHRAPDAAGAAYWTDQIINHHLTWQGALQGLATSPEAVANAHAGGWLF